MTPYDGRQFSLDEFHRRVGPWLQSGSLYDYLKRHEADCPNESSRESQVSEPTLRQVSFIVDVRNDRQRGHIKNISDVLLAPNRGIQPFPQRDHDQRAGES